MAALTANKIPAQSDDRFCTDDVAAAVEIFAGALVSLDSSGNARPARATASDTVRGVAQVHVDNLTGAAGAKTVRTEAGVFHFENSAGGDEITKAHFGQTCYVVDDQTVARTSSGGTRPPAGRIVRLQDGKVAVYVARVKGAEGDLLAANNLSDVASAATSRANIGANVGEYQMVIDTLVGTGVTRMPVPDKVCTITKIKSVIQGALATGDATLTFAINATPITTGVITITQAGSAAGDLDEVSPTAANVTDGADDQITCTVGGTNSAAVKALVTLEYTY